MINNTSPENLADIQAMVSRIEQISIGQTLPYETLDAALGRNSRDTDWLIRKAIDQVEAHTGAIFERVRGVGIKRLSREEIPSVGQNCIRKVRRTTRRAVKRMSAIRTNDLSHDDARQIIAQRSQLAAISSIADGRKTPVIERAIDNDNSALPVGRVLELFGRG